MFGINGRLDSIEHEIVKMQKLVGDMNVKLHAGNYCRDSLGNCHTNDSKECRTTVHAYENDDVNHPTTSDIFDKLLYLESYIEGFILKFEESLKKQPKVEKPTKIKSNRKVGRPRKVKEESIIAS